MTRIRKRGIALGVGLVALAAQLVPVERSNPEVHSNVPAPPEVEAILRQSCYDCHSHETIWPWYAYVAPASWLVAWDVHRARDEMNFSTWKAYRRDKRAQRREDMIEQIEEGHMPPWYYLLLHPRARLAPREVEALRTWVRSGGPPR